MALLRSHGITADQTEMQPRPEDELWNYQQIDLGFNYRMTEIQAALGLSQMQRLEEFVGTRHAIAARYDQLLDGLPLIPPWQHPDSYSGLHLYVVRLQLDKIPVSYRQVYETMRTAGVLVNLHYIPVYRQPYFETMGFVQGYCPQAEQYYLETLSLPMYPGLTTKQQDYVLTILTEATSK
jgi:dTDP-4-amino-4,6-dideoxygalactose transaminase